MKVVSNLLALALAAVFSTSIASATTYQFGSYATAGPNLGNQNSAMAFIPGISTDPQAPGITTNTEKNRLSGRQVRVISTRTTPCSRCAGRFKRRGSDQCERTAECI